MRSVSPEALALPVPLAALASLLALLVAAPALAWGSDGHGVQVEQVTRMVPEPLAAMLQAGDAVGYRSYPDNFSAFDPAELGEAAVAELTDQGLKRRYDLHTPHGMAVAFKLLVDALRNDEPAHAAIWAASLVHTIGDATAPNHEPIAHTQIYGLSKYGVTRPDGKGFAVPLDASAFRTGKDDRAVLLDAEASVGADAFPPLDTDPDRVLIEVMQTALTATDLNTATSGAILRAAARENRAAGDVEEAGNGDGPRESLRLLADLTTRGSRLSVRVLEAAWQLSRSGQTLTVTPTVLDAFDLFEREYVRNKPLTADQAFADAYDGEAEQGPAVGVVLEPTFRMDDAVLGFGARFLQSAILHTLRDTDTPYRVVDLRPLADGSAMLDPQTMPVLVLAQLHLRDFAGLTRDALLQAVDHYLDAGGRVVWIGGQPVEPLGPLYHALTESNKPDRYAKGYPVDGKDFAKGEVTLLADLTGSADRTLTFRADPDTDAGWHRPYSRYTISGQHDHVRPLIRYRFGDIDVAVGAAWVDDMGRSRAVFLPSYVVFPYLLGDEHTMPDLSRPTLHHVGRDVLLNTLRRFAAPVP